MTKLGVKGLTTYEVRGRGYQIGMIRTVDSEADYQTDDPVPKKKIDMVCIEEEVNKIVNSIVSIPQPGNLGMKRSLYLISMM